jgi:lipopolysaccharide export system permease protein
VIKKVDSFVLKSFIGPLILTFFIVLIIYLLQFLWLYVDDLAGKGLGLNILAELLYYFSLVYVPLAMPLAILFASLMTFGNMGEFSELVALKASGISLQRIMRPLMVFMVALAVVSFFFSNNVLPYANSKARTLLYDIRRKKPDINLQAGTFYNEVPEFVIKVTSKDPVTNRLDKIIIYDHREQRGNVSVTHADSGFMSITPDESGLIFTLYNGYSFTEIAERKANPDDRTHPSRTDYFGEQIIVIPLTGFDLERSQEGLFRSNAAALTLGELSVFIDSLGIIYNQRVSNNFNEYKSSKMYHLNNIYYGHNNRRAGTNNAELLSVFDTYNLLDSLPLLERKNAITRTIDYMKEGNTFLTQTGESHLWEIGALKRYEVTWYEKLTLSFACLVFFFIGAPLGAIIRKGGLGTPAVVAVLFFVIHYVITLVGKKLVEGNIVGTLAGTWAASYILLPIGIFLTYKATTDSAIMNIDTYLSLLKKTKNHLANFLRTIKNIK